MKHREEFRAYMKAANPTSGSDQDRHLSEAHMIAYCRGEVSAAEREAAEIHLAGCEQCIALFRSARDFLQPALADEEEVSAAQANEAWRSLLKRVKPATPTNAGVAGANAAPGYFQRLREKKSFPDSRVMLALAASLLLALGALGLLTWRLWQERQSRRQSEEAAMQLASRQRELEQRLSQLERSGDDELKRERDRRLAAEAERDQLETQLAAAGQAGPNIRDYPLRLSSERGAEDDLSLRLTSAAPAARLRLLISKPYEFEEYTVELSDDRGELVREISGLRPAGDDGALRVLLTRATLNTGKYMLRLFGVRAGTKTQLGEHELSVTVGR